MTSRVRSGATKLGTATVFAVGLAVVLAVLFGVATAARSGSGGSTP